MELEKILLELKEELGSIKSNVKNLQEDMSDLKQLLSAVVRIEEKQIELERKQISIEKGLHRVADLEKELIITKNDLDSLKEKLNNHLSDTKKVKDGMLKVFFSLLEKVIIWVILTLLSLKNFSA